MRYTEEEKGGAIIDQDELNNSKIDELSYSPSQKELPFFVSLFQYADKTNKNTQVSRDEALEVLSLSRLSRKKLDMILDMSMKKGSTLLNKDQFYVAVRLIQFRQNKETVRNLKLTVPDDVNLKPPFFKGFLEKKIGNNKMDPTLESCPQDESKEQDLQRSNSSSSSKFMTMEKEISKLKEELQTTKQKLHSVTKDNYILRNDENKASHNLVSRTKPNYKLQEKTKDGKSRLKLDRSTLFTEKQEDNVREIPRGRRRYLPKRQNDFLGGHREVSVPKLNCDDSIISDITEDTRYKYYPLTRSRSVECLRLNGYRSKPDNQTLFNRNHVHKRSKSFSNAYGNPFDINDITPRTKSGLRSFFWKRKANRKKNKITFD